MRGLLLCVMLFPLFVSCSGTSQHEKPTPSSTVQHRNNQKTENSEVTRGEQEVASLEIRDEITNSIGMKVALIPKGTFMMGSPENEKGRYKNETQHEVTISKDYYVGVYEVTQSQYENVMGENPSHFQGAEVGGENADFPVETVSWDDAVEFCNRLSELPEEKAAGRVYRLPTEAEWEYACRAGSKTAFCFGDSSELLGDYTWYRDNSNKRTHPVGEKNPNAWGLYDMHGNVWECCSDWYGDYQVRVIRGGCWNHEPAYCRSANRGGHLPSIRSYSLGFRVALSPSGIPGSPEAPRE